MITDTFIAAFLGRLIASKPHFNVVMSKIGFVLLKSVVLEELGKLSYAVLAGIKKELERLVPRS